MENMTWLAGIFTGFFKEDEGASAVSEILYNNDDLRVTFEPQERTGKILHIGSAYGTYDFYQSVKDLKKVVEDHNGILQGFMVVEMDNGEMWHVGISELNEVVKIDMEDIISLRTEDLMKVRDFVRSLS